MARTLSESSSTLCGYVERITYSDPDSGFTVLRLHVKGQRDLATVIVTHPGGLEPGVELRCQGAWSRHKQHGLQFQVSTCQVVLPHTPEGMERYLSSGLIKGVGPATARRIVEVFGDKTLDVLDHDPEQLHRVPKLGPKRIEVIREAWERQKGLGQLFAFLQSHGLGTQRAVRIHKRWGQDAMAQIQSNPYCLSSEIRGIGFQTADALALRLGWAHDAPERLGAGVLHGLQVCANRGHCLVSHHELMQTVAQLLSLEVQYVETHMAAAVDPDKVVPLTHRGEACYALSLYHAAECGIAESIRRLQAGPWSQAADPVALDAWLQRVGLTPSAQQKAAIVRAVSSKLSVLTGGPGVGKTTTVNAVVRWLKQQGLSVVLAAPTGRAAKRLSETTGFEAKTLHRLLRFDPVSFGFLHHRDNPLCLDYLVVDEASMIDVLLMRALLRALPDTAGVLWVGDVDQLPSVGPGLVLYDLIQSGQLPVSALTQVFRQAGQSQIVQNAHRINSGKVPFGVADFGIKKQDFYLFPCEHVSDLPSVLVDLVARQIPHHCGYAADQIQVLTPSRRGPVGSAALNASLQNRLNCRPDCRVERYGTLYAVGDRVIQTVNNYDKDVFNGDVGRIVDMDLEAQTLKILVDRRQIHYEFSELDELDLAYAVTVHKSQGSEYPVVVLPITMQHGMLLDRNVLYTGITRGKRLVVLMGERKAIYLACATQKAKLRRTFLREALE